jgi:flagellar biosynthetic protein FlhB
MARPEQTEKATPKRRQEARDKGQVARSQDIGGASVFLFILFVLHALLMPTIDAAGRDFVVVLQSLSAPHEPSIFTPGNLFVRDGAAFSFLLVVMFAGVVIVGLAANLAQFGFLFSLKPLQPNLGKLNPLAGLKRVFISKTTIVNLVKQLVKLAIVVMLVYTSLIDQTTELYGLAHRSPHDIIAFVDATLFAICLKFGLLLLAVGIVDYFYEKWNLAESQKMSKQEVKDEAKQSEGSPEAKMAVKQRQRAMARKRMMAAVPTATVVVTNPTHYAVALMWDDVEMDAPVVCAKGADLLAKRIRDIAKEHEIPIVENPSLARALYAQVDLDEAVPPALYSAVAQVIAFVYKLKRARSA